MTIKYMGLIIDGKGLGGNLQAQAYEKQVLTLLKRIRTTLTGRALFRELRRYRKHIVRIRPSETDKDIGPNQNEARSRAKDWKRAMARNQPMLYNDGSPWAGNVSGTGRGSDTTVFFTPSGYGYPLTVLKSDQAIIAKLLCELQLAGAQADEVLFHELVHAMRQIRGLVFLGLLRDGFQNEEEFIAILLTNIYSSETHRPPRSNHLDLRCEADDTDAVFLPELNPPTYRSLTIGKLVLQQQEMALEIGAVPADFNPIRQYYKLERISRVNQKRSA
ncbi:MAG: hypothetical protein FWD68_01955 [Alphaproteobacteria bacterium]|nr:hypothetical protein [Alphaproteobacteria bacterium]